jgi:hypothetical protein
VFNILSYVWLFVGSVLAFSLINYALLKISSSEFAFESYPSLIAMIAYGASTLALNESGRVSASGDMAQLLRLTAGFYGLCFLAVVAVNLLFTFGKDREDRALKVAS